MHVSDSRRGTLKSTARHDWSSCPHSWGVTLLDFTAFHFFSCGHFTLGWAPTLHGTFACSAPSVTLWSVGVRREGWGWGRHGLQSEQAVPSGLSTPIPCHSSDRECLVFLHQHCRKVGMQWWAASQAVPLCRDAVAQLLGRSPGVLGKSGDTHPGARGSWVAAEVKIARNLEKKKVSVGCERSWKAEIICRISFVN